MMFWRKRKTRVLSFRAAAFLMLAENFNRPRPSRLILQLWVERTGSLSEDEFIRAVAAIVDHSQDLDNPVAQVLFRSQLLAKQGAVQPDTSRLGDMIGGFSDAD